MYAVMRMGGKQFRVKEGDLLKISKLEGEVGSSVTFDDVLMVGSGSEVKVGKPTLAGAVVAGEIVRQDKHPKVYYFRTQEEGWDRIRGHRQHYTEVKITSVKGA